MTKLEQFILETLDDDYGINERAFATLQDLEDELKPTIPNISIMIAQAHGIEGRYYITEEQAEDLINE